MYVCIYIYNEILHFKKACVVKHKDRIKFDKSEIAGQGHREVQKAPGGVG